MKKYDHIVVGSGAAGLTATLLLALNGRKVLLLEKAPRLGGSLARFFIDGIPFNTGFHFTGGLKKAGILSRLLEVLGLMDAMEPVFLATERSHRLVFEDAQRTIVLPCGIGNIRLKLKSDFPGEQTGIDRYFDLLEKVYRETASTDIARLGEHASRFDEEHLSLKDVMDGLTGNALLKGVFASLGMCYGVKPSEVSFANHSRVCYDLYESTACFKGGGNALVAAFEDQFKKLDVEARCGDWVVEFRENQAGIVDGALLNSGQEISFDSAILTIHPKQILEMIPRRLVSKAFIERVASFEPSVGFFTVYGTLKDGGGSDSASSIVSLYPTCDFDAMLNPDYRGEQALVIVESQETVAGSPCRTASILEPSFPPEVSQWAGTSSGTRPADYTEYKQKRVTEILRHIGRYDADYARNLKVIGSASILTYRDYLNSYDGTAYGVKQKLGQFNLIGRLPGRALYAAGQSALLPGLVGTMMSSFIVGRSIIGKDNLGRFINERLCNH